MAGPNWMERIGDWFAARVASYLDEDYVETLKTNKKYYRGEQKRPLKTKPGQADDNLITNFIGLAVDRSNAMLFGGELEFVFPETASGGETELSERAQYLNAVWTANKKDKFLLLLANDGEMFGTYYAKIVPDGISRDGLQTHRLVILDPTLMAINVDPMDSEKVLQYVFEVKIEGEDKVVREITRRARADDYIMPDGEPMPEEPKRWIVETWVSQGLSARFVLIDKVDWPYEFPPILHGQNLPGVHSVYGVPGIESGIDPQDKFNFTLSNILKIIRYHAHPKTWGAGISGSLDKMSWGADEMIKITDPQGKIANLEMNSDMATSRETAKDLRQIIFDTSRTVDISSMGDKLGQLTNFGLRLLYSDALGKNSVRRLLYGEFLDELNRRLLIIGGQVGENAIPPKLQWGPELPSDEKQDAELVLADLVAGIVSKQTAAKKRGYEWDGDNGEAARIAKEQAAARVKSQNVGSQIVQEFMRGRVEDRTQ